MHFKGAQRILIVGRQKDNEGHPAFRQALQHVEATYSRHLHVKKEKIWLMTPDCLESTDAVFTVVEEDEIREGFKAGPNAAASQRFIVYDEHLIFHQAIRSMSRGKVWSAWLHIHPRAAMSMRDRPSRRTTRATVDQYS